MVNTTEIEALAARVQRARKAVAKAEYRRIIAQERLKQLQERLASEVVCATLPMLPQAVNEPHLAVA